jgi:hypothetical protein
MPVQKLNANNIAKVQTKLDGVMFDLNQIYHDKFHGDDPINGLNIQLAETSIRTTLSVLEKASLHLETTIRVLKRIG